MGAGHLALIPLALIAGAAGLAGYEMLLVHPKTPADFDKQSNRVLASIMAAFVGVVLLVLGFLLYAGAQ